MRVKLRSIVQALLWLIPLGTHAACPPEQVAQVYASPSRAPAEAAAMIAACRDAGPLAFDTAMQLGAIARDARDLPAAVDFYAKARAVDPKSVDAMGELALTYEWQREWAAAHALYDQMLAADPGSRPALLGLARIARVQYRLDEARAIYERLQDADPHDLEAQNGLAWVALANQRVAQARGGFERVLAVAPGNAEAKQGLRSAADTWPYELDVAGGYVSSPEGHAWGAGVMFRADLDAIRSIEVGALYYSNELPAADLTQERPLPKNDLHLGYHVRVPGGYNWALVYDYREHSTLPTEHWLEARVGNWVSERLQWVTSVRASFGASVWDSQLYQAGLVVPVADGWEVAPTVYYQYTNNQFGAGALGQRNLLAYGVDVKRQGPGRSFLNIGAGYSPDISNVDLHARAVWPLTAQGALLLSIQHVSVNRQLEASIGWRFYWQ